MMAEIITIDSTDDDDDDNAFEAWNGAVSNGMTLISRPSHSPEPILIDSSDDDDDENEKENHESEYMSECFQCGSSSKCLTYQIPSQEPLTDLSNSSGNDPLAGFGRKIFRSYINGFRILPNARMHSAICYGYCKNTFEARVDTSDVSSKCFVKTLGYSYDTLFDVLLESIQRPDSDWTQLTAFAERWTSHQIEKSPKMDKAIIRILHQSRDSSLSYACYRILMTSVNLFPSLNNLPFSSSELMDVIDAIKNCVDSSGLDGKNPTVINCVLTLAYMINSLEAELIYCDHVSKQSIHLSSVSSWLSAEKKYTLVKRIIEIIPKTLRYRESSIGSTNTLPEISTNCLLVNNPYRIVVSLLQRLLQMSYVVSSYPVRMADRFAVDLALGYVDLPSQSQRFTFLESVVAVPLVRLKLCQRILERQFSRSLSPSSPAVMPSSGGMYAHRSLTVLVNKYLKIDGVPADQCKSDVCFGVDWLRNCAGDDLQPSTEVEACEEYAVLFYSMVQSFLQLKLEGMKFTAFNMCIISKQVS